MEGDLRSGHAHSHDLRACRARACRAVGAHDLGAHDLRACSPRTTFGRAGRRWKHRRALPGRGGIGERASAGAGVLAAHDLRASWARLARLSGVQGAGLVCSPAVGGTCAEVRLRGLNARCRAILSLWIVGSVGCGSPVERAARPRPADQEARARVTPSVTVAPEPVPVASVGDIPSDVPATGVGTTTDARVAGGVGAAMDEATTNAAAPGPEADERPAARLCAKPYRLSGTPGKGAGRAGKSAGDDAEATARLRRGFDVRVDGGEPLRWTTKQGFELDGLDPRKRHTIVISTAKGKRIRELKLDFRARGSDDLCLAFNDFYHTWQLRKLRSGRRCGPCVTR